MENKNQKSRTDFVSWGAIIVAILLGFLLKRLKFGFVIGISLGLLVVYLWKKKIEIN